jgi:DNA-binding MarR family transcriptional regulator
MKNRLVPQFDLAFEHPDESAGFLVWKTANTWQRKIKEQLDPVGLTPVQFLLLNSLAALNKNQSLAITQKMLSDYSGCDKMMTSKVLRSLEEKKLVQRKNHHSDTRSFSLLLTTKGMDLLQLATPAFSLAEKAFFDTLKKKESKFSKHLKKLNKSPKKASPKKIEATHAIEVQKSEPTT